MSQRLQAWKTLHSSCLGFDGATTPNLGTEGRPNGFSREHTGSWLTTTNGVGTLQKRFYYSL